MAVNSCEEECPSVHSVVVLPEGGDAGTQCETHSSLASLEVSKLMKIQTTLIFEPIEQKSQTKGEVDKANSYDLDIEKGKTEFPKFNEESLTSLKSDDLITRALLREICLKIGGKLMHLLMNHETELPKFTSRDKLVTERVHDTTINNRSRKYKRSASFNSRRVVLLFSILSIIGTIILIYLTLRVRHISDASGNV